MNPVHVKPVVMACCCLHNILCNRRPARAIETADVEDPVTHEVTPGVWRNEGTLTGLERTQRRSGSAYAMNVRTYITAYCNSPVGSVPWQDRMIQWYVCLFFLLRVYSLLVVFTF